jgi:cytochrome P450
MDDELLWRPHRKAADPAFRSSVLKSYLSLFNNNAKVCVELLEKRCVDGEIFNLTPVWERLTLDNILTTSMGINEHIQNDENSEYFSNMNL